VIMRPSAPRNIAYPCSFDRVAGRSSSTHRWAKAAASVLLAVAVLAKMFRK
jgi:hypothetical protein